MTENTNHSGIYLVRIIRILAIALGVFVLGYGLYLIQNLSGGLIIFAHFFISIFYSLSLFFPYKLLQRNFGYYLVMGLLMLTSLLFLYIINRYFIPNLKQTGVMILFIITNLIILSNVWAFFKITRKR